MENQHANKIVEALIAHHKAGCPSVGTDIRGPVGHQAQPDLILEKLLAASIDEELATVVAHLFKKNEMKALVDLQSAIYVLSDGIPKKTAASFSRSTGRDSLSAADVIGMDARKIMEVTPYSFMKFLADSEFFPLAIGSKGEYVLNGDPAGTKIPATDLMELYNFVGRSAMALYDFSKHSIVFKPYCQWIMDFVDMWDGFVTTTIGIDGTLKCEPKRKATIASWPKTIDFDVYTRVYDFMCGMCYSLNGSKGSVLLREDRKNFLYCLISDSIYNDSNLGKVVSSLHADIIKAFSSKLIVRGPEKLSGTLTHVTLDEAIRGYDEMVEDLVDVRGCDRVTLPLSHECFPTGAQAEYSVALIDTAIGATSRKGYGQIIFNGITKDLLTGMWDTVNLPNCPKSGSTLAGASVGTEQNPVFLVFDYVSALNCFSPGDSLTRTISKMNNVLEDKKLFGSVLLPFDLRDVDDVLLFSSVLFSKRGYSYDIYDSYQHCGTVKYLVVHHGPEGGIKTVDQMMAKIVALVNVLFHTSPQVLALSWFGIRLPADNCRKGFSRLDYALLVAGRKIEKGQNVGEAFQRTSNEPFHFLNLFKLGSGVESMPRLKPYNVLSDEEIDQHLAKLIEICEMEDPKISSDDMHTVVAVWKSKILAKKHFWPCYDV